MKSSPSDSRERRTRLLSAASGLFARWGYDKTSVEDIARECGISKGAVYLEFPSKEDLFQAVVFYELGKYTEDWMRRFENDPGEWSFAQMFQHSLAATQVNPVVRALLTRDQKVFGSFLRSDNALFASVIAMRAELFAQLQKIGAMRTDIPASVAAYLISAIGYGLVSADDVIPPESRVPFEDALKGLGLLLDRGLAPEQMKSREEAKDFILAMVEKMKVMLTDGKEAKL